MRVSIINEDKVSTVFNEENRDLQKMAIMLAGVVGVTALFCGIKCTTPTQWLAVIVPALGISATTFTLITVSVKCGQKEVKQELSGLLESGINSVGITRAGKILVNGRTTSVVRELNFTEHKEAVLDIERGVLYVPCNTTEEM